MTKLYLLNIVQDLGLMPAQYVLFRCDQILLHIIQQHPLKQNYSYLDPVLLILLFLFPDYLNQTDTLVPTVYCLPANRSRNLDQECQYFLLYYLAQMYQLLHVVKLSLLQFNFDIMQDLEIYLLVSRFAFYSQKRNRNCFSSPRWHCTMRDLDLELRNV